MPGAQVGTEVIALIGTIKTIGDDDGALSLKAYHISHSEDTGWGGGIVPVGISGCQQYRGSTKVVGDQVNTCRSVPGFSHSNIAVPESLCGLSVPAY